MASPEEPALEELAMESVDRGRPALEELAMVSPEEPVLESWPWRPRRSQP
jgi:hypothetical protein